MSSTLVIQSHREPLPHRWLRACLDSVAAWARQNAFDYRFVGDELFDLVDPALLDKTAAQTVIATDLARLRWLQRELGDGYACVVWCDADFFVIDAAALLLPDTEFALGREVWVQRDQRDRLRVYTKVHNAFLMFRRGNSFLDFYSATAERLLRLNQGSMPPQFIGPKLLSAIHNIAQCPVQETAGMLSPLVQLDLLDGGGPALDLFREHSPAPPAGVNLSASQCARGGLDDETMERVIAHLRRHGITAADEASARG